MLGLPRLTAFILALSSLLALAQPLPSAARRSVIVKLPKKRSQWEELLRSAAASSTPRQKFRRTILSSRGIVPSSKNQAPFVMQFTSTGVPGVDGSYAHHNYARISPGNTLDHASLYRLDAESHLVRIIDGAFEGNASMSPIQFTRRRGLINADEDQHLLKCTIERSGMLDCHLDQAPSAHSSLAWCNNVMSIASADADTGGLCGRIVVKAHAANV